MRFVVVLLASLALFASEGAVLVGPNPHAVQFFESKIRPVFIKHCYECHGNGMRKGGLNMDSLAAMLAGGHDDIVLTPGDPNGGNLMASLRWEGDSDLNMPPKYQLPPDIIADVETWIRMGAPWPAATAPMVQALAKAERPPLLASLHPALVHLPIGMLVLAGIAELCVLILGSAWIPAVTVAAIGGAGGAILAVISGLSTTQQETDAIELHEQAGWTTLVFAFLVAVLAVIRQRSPGSRWPLRILLAGALLAVAITGHLGGVLVHGEWW